MNQKIHPWAADPTCIGALAITQLAILAAKDGTCFICDFNLNSE
jgi:hypothetical protein